jgi:hypothetical protein
MAEFFYSITPSYSVCWVDESVPMLRIKSTLNRDHGGDQQEQLRMQAATANMTASLARELDRAAGMFSAVDEITSKALNATHVDRGFVPDPFQAKPQ